MSGLSISSGGVKESFQVILGFCSSIINLLRGNKEAVEPEDKLSNEFLDFL